MTEYSIEEERKLAKTFMGRIEWEMIVIGIGQCLIWFGLWFMVVQGAMALWLGCVLSILSTSWSYLPSHAGQHGHLSGKNKNLEWLNAFVGQISLIPLAQSHHVLKALHLKHHAHTNDPDRDPDQRHGQAKNWFQAALKVHDQTGCGKKVLEVVDRLLEDDPKFEETSQSRSNGKFYILFCSNDCGSFIPFGNLIALVGPQEASRVLSWCCFFI